MSFSPFARYRNFNLKNLKELLDIYPDMARHLSWNEAGEIIQINQKAYKKTAYQQACQFGLEDRGGNYFKIQSYLYAFEDEGLEKYIKFWMKTYYAPNPYVQSNDSPIIIYCKLGKELLNRESLLINCDEFYNKIGVVASIDILQNAIMEYCDPIKYNKDDNCFFIDKNDINHLKQEIEFIESEFPIKNSKDKKEFFDRYSFQNYCKFYGIAYDRPTDDYVNYTQSIGLLKADNILLYGVPGCGKSHYIKTEYCSDETHMERAVFHPDYTYSDFVGQILPKVEGEKVKYEFTPGPFTRIMKKAYNNPSQMFHLVIEEINRGNAPAIFGDIFQLLDRDENGTSEYGVSNGNVAKEIYGDEETKVKIPGNLYVLATMNTSDQNVFTLDTAFKRRWSLKRIENVIDGSKYADIEICSFGITWGTFAKTINRKIVEHSDNNFGNEDNRLGAYFISPSDLEDAERFGEKVLMYLWNDAFKLDRECVFKSEYRTLDELLDGFYEVGLEVFCDDIVFATDTSASGDISSYVLTDEKYISSVESKYPEYVALYKKLLCDLQERIPGVTAYGVGSNGYVFWNTSDIRKKGFVDVSIKKDGLHLAVETPTDTNLLDVGIQKDKDNHHKHYYEILYTESEHDRILAVLEDSYNQMKKPQE